jgi:hypothetical protein
LSARARGLDVLDDPRAQIESRHLDPAGVPSPSRIKESTIANGWMVWGG